MIYAYSTQYLKRTLHCKDRLLCKKKDEYKFNIHHTAINNGLNENKKKDPFQNFFMINRNQTNSTYFELGLFLQI